MMPIMVKHLVLWIVGIVALFLLVRVLRKST
jgi:hypothetical protein